MHNHFVEGGAIEKPICDFFQLSEKKSQIDNKRILQGTSPKTVNPAHPFKPKKYV